MPHAITSLRAERLDVPMKKPFGIAGGAQVHARNVLVTLETSAGGVCGWGEGAPFPAFNGETQEDVLAAIAGVALEGVALDDTEAIRARLHGACKSAPSARCAIESAVVDARARVAGRSLHDLFGGATRSLVTDITITTGSIAEAEAEARAFAAFSTLKIKVGAGDVDLDVARVRAVRAARPDARLLVDANAGFAVADALRFLRATREAEIALFEQPARDWDALAEIRAAATMPIAIDESVTSAEDVELAKRLGAADAVNLKIMKSGVFEALAIAERARAEGLTLMIGGMVETRLAMGTSACLAAGLGGFAFIDLDTPLFLAADPFHGGYAQDGERIDLAAVTLGHGIRPL